MTVAMASKAMKVLVLVFTLASLSSVLVLAQDKGASLSLKARWKETAYIHEAAEFLVRVGSDRANMFLFQC